MARVVVVTGVSGYLGAEVAGVLRREPGIERLIDVTGPDATRPYGGWYAAGGAAGSAVPAAEDGEHPPGQAGPDHGPSGRPSPARTAPGETAPAPAVPSEPGPRGTARSGAAPGHGRPPDERVVRLDVRTGEIGDLIRATGADTVVHLGLATTPASAGGRASMKETNVIGALQILNACQRSAAVRKLVVRSSSAVYGTSAQNPAVFTEDSEPRADHGYARDVADVERYVRGLARRRPDITVSVLRFVNFLGPGVDSPLTRYFTMPVPPTVLGYDPRIQFIDICDGVEVIRRMAVEEHPGTYNVTAHGVMVMSQCLRRAGRVPVPVLQQALGVLADLGRRVFPDVSPDQRDLLRYGRVVDGTKLEKELNWAPRYSTQEAFDRFVADRRLTAGPALSAIDRVLTALAANAGGEHR